MVLYVVATKIWIIYCIVLCYLVSLCASVQFLHFIPAIIIDLELGAYYAIVIELKIVTCVLSEFHNVHWNLLQKHIQKANVLFILKKIIKAELLLKCLVKQNANPTDNFYFYWIICPFASVIWNYSTVLYQNAPSILSDDLSRFSLGFNVPIFSEILTEFIRKLGNKIKTSACLLAIYTYRKVGLFILRTLKWHISVK